MREHEPKLKPNETSHVAEAHEAVQQFETVEATHTKALDVVGDDINQVEVGEPGEKVKARPKQAPMKPLSQMTDNELTKLGLDKFTQAGQKASKHVKNLLGDPVKNAHALNDAVRDLREATDAINVLQDPHTTWQQKSDLLSNGTSTLYA